MSTLFLSAGELEELTGFKSARGQLGWLERNRWVHATNRSGQPRVARDYFQAKVGAGSAMRAGQVNLAAAGEQPNFAAIGRR